jgi:hypothetical protein
MGALGIIRLRELRGDALASDIMAAGSMAGVIQIIATYPLDLIRTRLQLVWPSPRTLPSPPRVASIAASESAEGRDGWLSVCA